MELISALLGLGLLFAVPLGLAILSKRTLHPRERQLIQIARWVQPFAALSASVSFFSMPGRLAAGLTLPWLALAGVLGLACLVRLINGGWRFPAPLCYTAALGFLPIGAAWLFASRLGINPGGFGEPIVLLTAVHFHFSGFSAAIIAGEVIRRSTSSKANAWIASGTILATPLVATGFVFSALLKLIAIFFFSTTLLTLAFIQIRVARTLPVDWGRRFLFVSALSVVAGMLLAGLYGVSDYTGWPLITISQMAHSHGVVNAIGFTLCGLLGWFLIAEDDISKGVTHG